MPRVSSAGAFAAGDSVSGFSFRGHTSTSGLSWPSPLWTMPLWCFVLAYAWSRVTTQQFAAAGETTPALGDNAGAGAAVAFAMRVVGTLFEAAVFCLIWRGRGQRLPYWRFVSYLAFGSFADLLAFELLQRFGHEHATPWLVALVGPGALGARTTLRQPGLATAFASFGALTLLRMVWTSFAQARALSRPLVQPLALTLLLWLATHAGLWFALDLMRGRSVAG